MTKTAYGVAIREGFEYLLETHKNVFTIGQGLWSPWYVGNSMSDLDKKFGIERVIDTPVSELATTGAALGASLCGYRPVVIHPRVDFMLLAVDQIVSQAAKWRSMFGGQVSAALTVRGIINRGGQQGAQHSQALHSWFAHIPGLHVVMPATASDARDLLIAAVMCDDPVLYLDDRWLYETEEELAPVKDVVLDDEGPRVLRAGKDVTLVGCGYTTKLCLDAADLLAAAGVSAEVIDLRILNPLKPELIISSVAKTGRLLVADGDWKTCGMAAEIIALVAESADWSGKRQRYGRVTHPDAPAPTSSALENEFYFSAKTVSNAAQLLLS
jgi:pyruvate/2-oxoglutarate/acetoin dehydrogenase E1 component